MQRVWRSARDCSGDHSGAMETRYNGGALETWDQDGGLMLGTHKGGLKNDRGKLGGPLERRVMARRTLNGALEKGVGIPGGTLGSAGRTLNNTLETYTTGELEIRNRSESEVKGSEGADGAADDDD
ncbi:hypothetical protein CRENBAI_010404 [Crenichthys baileyi]|uniref:Uncharacterized protein n=1 Tax=Crenichthys baileyi TaxID=28760 RepID=A0AAV9QTN2_9TELE